jgi:hypothetical protein
MIAERERPARRPDLGCSIARFEPAFYSSPMRAPLPTLMVLSLVAAGLAGCDKKDGLEKERGAAPPPVASTKPGACSGGGGKVSDSVSAGFFPRVAGSYCVDPNGETRSFGEGAGGSLDKVCTELFDGECEVYKQFGLQRVVTLRYIDGGGSPGSINVNLSRFATVEGAYGFFTKRVIADGDPLEVAPAALEAGTAAALGTGIAYVWRGQHVAELSYTNELESPDQLKTSSQKVLPPLGKDLGDKLPGDKAFPKAVTLLPTDKRVNMGVGFVSGDLLDVSGAGPGALGYYKDGDKRYRVLSTERPDEASAKDVLKTLRKLEGAKGVKGVLYDAVSFVRKADDQSPGIAWVVGRHEGKLFGVGDEEHVLSAEQSAEDAAKLKLNADEKMTMLSALIEAAKAPKAP